MSNRRRPFPLLWIASFTALMGLIALISVSNSPRFETFHALDVIRLMTAGWCFGIAFIMLILFIRGPRFLEDNRAGEKSGEESN